MGALKHYYLALICIGIDQIEQDAIEWALLQGWFKPRYHFDNDKAAIEALLPELMERFQEAARETHRAEVAA